MKKLYLFILLCSFINIELTAQLSKIYGDNNKNHPTVIKAFNDGVYVASYRTINNQDYAIFSKFALNTLAIVWEKKIEVPAYINDFDYNAATDELVLVGHTLAYAPFTNNQSFWAIINGAGTSMVYKSIDQVQSNATYPNNPGKEIFNRIIRHTTNGQFYILGAKNPLTATFGYEDLVVLYELNSTGYTLNWGYELTYTNPPDDEFMRGLFQYGNNVILTGNIVNNDGILVEFNVTNRTVVRSYRYPNNLDIYDGVDLGNGYLAIVAEDFANHRAYLTILDPSLGTAAGVNSNWRFTDIINFKDVWKDANGNLYVIGENKTMPIPFNKDYQAVYKFGTSLSPTNSSLTFRSTLYLSSPNGQDIDYSDGLISVTPDHNKIFYTHSYLSSNPVFGNRDMVVAAYDPTLFVDGQNCLKNFAGGLNHLRISPITAPITATRINPLPVPSMPPFIMAANMNAVDFCSSNPIDCSFDVKTSDCFNAQFTANPMPAGTYNYVWDIGCNGASGDITTNTPIFNHTFPCGGGTYQVCLKITTPSGFLLCQSTKTVIISNDCCGTVTSAVAECTKTPCLFTFKFTVVPPAGITNCTPTVGFLNSTPNGTPGYTVTPSTTGVGWDIEGGSFVPCNNVPQSLSYTVNFNCICPTTGLPIGCSLPVNITTPCCKPIQVGNHTVCETMPTYNVPVLPLYWSPLMNITSVTWYVLPKPATGCPTPPWTGVGATPYQVTTSNVLEPLHLYPANLTGDVCVYAVVTLNDGNCTVLTSNVASITLCKPSSYTLTNLQYCYSGTPVPIPILGLTVTPTPACSEVVSWLNPAGQLIPGSTGSYTYQPPALSMANPTQCYEDFIYTMQITDDCGVRDYPIRIRLFSQSASIGTLAINPLEPYAPMTLLCNGEDLTLTFTPNCASNPPLPPTWSWYKRDCIGGSAGPIVPLPTAGTMNGVYNTNRLTATTWYGVTAINGVCSARSVEKLIEVKNLTVINSFTAVPDACVATNVNLTINFTGCTLECTNGTCACGYEVTWYKDGGSIGTTNSFTAGSGGNLAGSLSYTTQPLAGNYYAVLKTCCNEILTTSVVTVTPTCVPKIKGPCFICRNKPEILTVEMFLPVNKPCPYGTNCTYLWSVVAGTGGTISGPTSNSTVTVTSAGTYQVITTCITPYGTCVRTVQFVLPGCTNPLLCVLPAVNLTTGLTGFFPFNGNANDVSPTLINGIASNLIPATALNGIPNSAFSFNGTTSWIDGTNNNRGVTDKVSVCAWVRTTELLRGMWVAGQYNGGQFKGYLLSIGDVTNSAGSIGLASFSGRVNSGPYYAAISQSNVKVNDGAWHCIIGTAGIGTTGISEWKIYVDAVLRGSVPGATSTIAPSTTPFTIGRHSDLININNGPMWYNGNMDDVRVYNKVLTQCEIDSLCSIRFVSGVGDINNKMRVSIFPNPNRGSFTLELSKRATVKMSYRVTNLMGQLIFENPIETGSEQQTVEVKDLTEGLYFLHIVSDGKVVAIEKFVKQ